MLRALGLALGFLTRIAVRMGPIEASDYARALFWFPTVGALLAAILATAFWVSSGWLSAHVAAALTLALWVWLTGGLHADGLADTADGLSAAHGNPARALEVMRDPRVGAHGALSLVVVGVVKYALLVDLAQVTGGWLALAAALGTSLCAARFWVAQCVVHFPSARKDGMGVRFRNAASRELAVLGVVPWLALAALLAYYQPGLLRLQALAALGCGALLLTLAWRWSKSFGGLTGDLYGALVELGEAGTLLAWHVLASPLLTEPLLNGNHGRS
jgi:adenosylcobinamide-GDP ribazoletransferase